MRHTLLTLIIVIFLPSYAFAQNSSIAESNDEFETYETKHSEVYDPYEKLNRKVYAFNDAFDRYFFEHIAKAYRNNVPKGLRRLIHNFLNNLSLPVSTFNSFAQGNVDNGLATFSNFLINTTVGIGGIFDIAEEKGIFYQREDFGQTLGRYNTGPGAYLVVPFLGPSSTRDFSGWLADRTIDPLGLNAFGLGGSDDLIDSNYRIGVALMTSLDSRESLIEIIDDIRRESFDPYSTMRSAYLQKRKADIEKDIQYVRKPHK